MEWKMLADLGHDPMHGKGDPKIHLHPAVLLFAARRR